MTAPSTRAKDFSEFLHPAELSTDHCVNRMCKVGTLELSSSCMPKILVNYELALV